MATLTQPNLNPTNPDSLGGQPCSYCIPQPTLVCWGGQPGFLMYTSANPDLLGWSARVPIVYPI